MRPYSREPYSYRIDPQVPEFEDGQPIVFMDGECMLCSRSARLIARLDTSESIRICPVQSPTGKAVLTHYGLDSDNPESWLYLEDGLAYGALDGIIHVGERLGGWGRLTSIFRLLPQGARNWLYRRIARNRYSFFGKTQICDIPDPALRRRLMT